MTLTTLSYFTFETNLHLVAFNADPNTRGNESFETMFILPSQVVCHDLPCRKRRKDPVTRVSPKYCRRLRVKCHCEYQ